MCFDRKNRNELKIYNSASSITMTNEEFRDFGLKFSSEDPFDEMVWFPNIYFTESPTMLYVLFLILQVFPAALIDTFSSFTNKKKR